MSEKIPCVECGAAVLPSTAERTGGLCMPCKSGNRKNIERAKEYYKRERELDRTCPFRALWRGLIDKVYKQESGFAGLSEDEKLYFAVNVLTGEVYNGGFIQYFENSSGKYYRQTELGLIRLGATNALGLLRQAKEALFESSPVPQDRTERWAAIQKHSNQTDLDPLDTEFYKDVDQLDKKLEAFALESGLVNIA